MLLVGPLEAAAPGLVLLIGAAVLLAWRGRGRYVWAGGVLWGLLRNPRGTLHLHRRGCLPRRRALVLPGLGRPRRPTDLIA